MPSPGKAGCIYLGTQPASWGHTREEALKHIDEVVQLVVESMVEHGDKLPEETTDEVQITVEPRVTVNGRPTEDDLKRLKLIR